MRNDFQELTLKIYDTVADPGLWPDVLDRFVTAVDAQGCIIFDWEQTAGGRQLCAPYFSGYYRRGALDLYLKRYAYLEERDQQTLQRLTGDSDGVEVVDDTVFQKSAEELKRDGHVRRLRSYGIFRRAACVLNKDNRGISLFCVHLKDTGQPLDARQRQVMGHCLPHFAKALDLGLPFRRLESLNEGILASFDRLAVGLCLLDSNGNVVARNAEFAR